MWALTIEVSAERALRRIDRTAGKRIKTYLLELCTLQEPTDRGKALTGQWAGHWRYRVGDYRIICRIVRSQLIVSVVELGHRSSVYD